MQRVDSSIERRGFHSTFWLTKIGEMDYASSQPKVTVYKRFKQ